MSRGARAERPRDGRADVALYFDAGAQWDRDTCRCRSPRRSSRSKSAGSRSRCFADDLEGHRRLGEQTTHPDRRRRARVHACGGTAISWRSKALSVWQPDACWVGGMTVMRDIFALGQANGIWVVPHRGSEVWGLHADPGARRPAARRGWATVGDLGPGRAGDRGRGTIGPPTGPGLRRRLRRRAAGEA